MTVPVIGTPVIVTANPPTNTAHWAGFGGPYTMLDPDAVVTSDDTELCEFCNKQQPCSVFSACSFCQRNTACLDCIELVQPLSCPCCPACGEYLEKKECPCCHHPIAGHFVETGGQFNITTNQISTTRRACCCGHEQVLFTTIEQCKCDLATRLYSDQTLVQE